MKVLIILNNLRVANGVATTIMNQYDQLIENECDVHFMNFIALDSPYISLIKENGGKIFTVSKKLKSIITIAEVIRNEKYDIVHVNQMNAQTVLIVCVARLLGVRSIIYHSHNTKIPGGLKRSILEKLCNFMYLTFANSFLACSIEAGKDAFGKKEFSVMKNAIDVNRFAFSNQKRVSIREELDISTDTFVVGTVCRYSKQKNPLFMIDIVSEIIKIYPNTVFLWVGSALNNNDPVLTDMLKRVRELDIEKNMRWVGSKVDVYNWYSAMDVFIMPSIWEGLGITYLEAQANSLPTFASDVVPKEAKITDLLHYISLSETATDWAKKICKYNIRKTEEKDYYDDFVSAGYELKNAGSDLYNMYCKFLG